MLRALRPLRSGMDRLFLSLAMMLACAQPAFAQNGWLGRIDLSLGPQIDTNRLAESITLTKYVEPTPLTADLSKATVPMVDIGASLRVAGNLALGVSVSYLTNTGEADVAARIPHPFYFGQPRSIAGSVTGVEHKELTTHTDLMYAISSRRIDLVLFGGASFFRVDQTFVSDVTYSELYPYDTASFVDATFASDRRSKVGYNAGADATWKLSRKWGLGGMIRFAHARVPFTVGDIDAGSTEVGGLQAAGGLRLVFYRRPRRPAPPRRANAL